MRLVLPALLTIQSGINRPRYPSLTNMMRSRHQALTTLPFELPPDEAKASRIRTLSEPITTDSAIFFEGTREEKAGALLDLLTAKGVLIT